MRSCSATASAISPRPWPAAQYQRLAIPSTSSLPVGVPHAGRPRRGRCGTNSGRVGLANGWRKAGALAMGGRYLCAASATYTPPLRGGGVAQPQMRTSTGTGPSIAAPSSRAARFEGRSAGQWSRAPRRRARLDAVPPARGAARRPSCSPWCSPCSARTAWASGARRSTPPATPPPSCSTCRTSVSISSRPTRSPAGCTSPVARRTRRSASSTSTSIDNADHQARRRRAAARPRR